MKIENFTKRYGDKTIYENFNLTVEEGKITCVLGESGCGKTTLLNAISSLTGYEGQISPVTSSYVFQSPRLLPNLTVLKNLTLIGADESSAREMLESTGIGEAEAYPHALSGGEAQRVALCRAFLYPSDILLMDEPFSSLDLKTKLSVMELFINLQKEGGRTALFVTHDVDEALFLADRIVVIAGGKIIGDFQNDKKSAFGADSPLRAGIIEILLS